MLKKILLSVLALVLLALPLALRWFTLHEGQYKPQDVARPDVSAIKAPSPYMEPFADQVEGQRTGTVVIDLAHGNRFEMAELGILRARLAARGLQIEQIEMDGELAEKLRYAHALVVISPGLAWTPDEIREVQAFVDKGGRLLLVTDPTRYEVLWDEWGYYAGLESDVVHMNDLAAQFGMIFQPDYLYNTVQNEGNFRNIPLTDYAAHQLTRGLDEVVFYAAHSIASDELALIKAGGDTRSSSSERTEDLAVGVLAGAGGILALGDLTFMTEPYNAVANNDRLIANIADFLADADRKYQLVDFPYFFGEQVDLVYADDPLLDSDLLAEGRTLQVLFDERGRELILRETEDKDLDTLFLGLYSQAEEVEAYLDAAQVTLSITPTVTAEGAASSVTPTATVEPSEELTSTVTLTAGLANSPATTITGTAGITVTGQITPTAKNRVEIESLGEMVLTGTSLFLLETDGDRRVLVVLAATTTGLKHAVERLADGDMDDCLFTETGTAPTVIALCPTGEVAPGEGEGGWQEEEPGPAPPTPAVTATETVTETEEPVEGTVEPPEIAEPEGSILVVALDVGEGQVDSRTSADDYVAILQDRYEVTVWMLSERGSLDSSMMEYDLIIWTSGDFLGAFSEDVSGLLFMVMLEGIPVIVSGANVDDTASVSVQRDIRVSDPTHPMARGFEPGEVISFVPATSGAEYKVDIHEDVLEEEGTTIAFTRGPGSEDEGVPSVFAMKDESSGMQLAFIGFPLYLLPESAKSQLVLNTVEWMLAP